MFSGKESASHNAHFVIVSSTAEKEARNVIDR